MSAADQLEQKFPGLLDGIKYVESRGNPNAVNPRSGAAGAYGLMPATAAHYGVDPHNPDQAREAAAQNMSEGLTWSGGDVDRALRYYQGGPNTNGWGSDNAAYPGLVLNAIQRRQTGSNAPQSSAQPAADPFEAAMTGAPRAPIASPRPSASSSSDPFEAAMVGATVGANDRAPPSAIAAGQEGPDRRADQLPDRAMAGNQMGVPQPTSGSNAGIVAAAPVSSADGALRNALKGISDFGVGVASGVASVPGTAAVLIGKGLDYTGLTEGAGDNALKNSDDLQKLLASHEYNPNGWATAGGRLTGDIAATLPAAEIKIFDAAKYASPLARALARTVNYGVQGATAGAAVSGGHDIAGNAALGGALGPVGGVVGERAIAPAASALASGLKSAAMSAITRTMPAEVRDGITQMIDSGSSVAGIQAKFPEWAEMGANHKTLNWYVNNRLAGGKTPVNFQAEPTASPDQAGEDITVTANRGGPVSPAPANANTANVANALKNAGAGRGIESVRDMPQSIADDVAAARAKGVPLEHAQREADVRYVGAEPTIGSTTRDPTAQRLEKVNANLDTPEGAALATRAASNNAAVHDTVQKTIEGYGGVPAQGEVSQTVAQSLANASDAEYGKVSALYKQGDEEAAALKGSADTETAQRQAAADAQVAAKAQATARQELNAAQAAYKAAKLNPGADLEKASNDLVFARDGLRQATTSPPKAPPVPSRTGAGYIDVSPLRDALDAPATKNATIDGLNTLANGTRGYIDALSNGTNRVSASEAESIRAGINDAYDIRGGSINSHVGRLKGILDQSMDAATDVPASYREGRAAYRAWAAKYEDPEGVANIIRRDAKGNFLNEDNWRRADNGLIGTTNEQQFQQVTRRLLANRDVETLNRLKAELVHRPYDAASKGAGDQNNHAVFSPSKWRDTINSIGMNKYRALFDKDEVAHLATIYRAAQNLHEPVPGVANTSNSGTTLINAAGMADAVRKAGEAGKPSGGNAALVRGIRGAGHLLVAPLHIAPGLGALGHLGVEGAAGAAARRGGQKAVSAANKELAAAIQRTLDPAVARNAANENAKRALTAASRKNLAAAVGRFSAPAGPAATGKASRSG